MQPHPSEIPGLVRAALVAPEHRVGDVGFNGDKIAAALAEAAQAGAQLAVFPELSLTGYGNADLFYQDTLLRRAREALVEVAGLTAKHPLVAVVGLPLEVHGRLYNCAAFLAEGRVLGLVPKRYLPNYNEFYEERWFTTGEHLTVDAVRLGPEAVPVSPWLLFQAANMRECLLGIEVCEDLWAVEPPSGAQALAGATVLVNLSASPETLGKADYRRELVRHQSARCLAAYLYATGGPGESSTDLVYSGHCMAAENGKMLVEGERFAFETRVTLADVDVRHLVHERLRNSSFSFGRTQQRYEVVAFTMPRPGAKATQRARHLHRPQDPDPFVPNEPARRTERCREIFAIQATALARRVRHTGLESVTLGISGGLDSCLALLVTARAFDKLGLPRTGIVTVSMPGFGTTQRTRNNADKLCAQLGTTHRTIPIHAAVEQHFRDIGHDPENTDVVYENAQARERTQILMDVGNQTGGFVVGTGDLSEAALGWCTFNADHMSMYHVNIGVPKTLVRYLVDWAADELFTGDEAAVLHDIAATPITPELLPLGGDRTLAQETERSIGPYRLHDFFLFHVVRHGDSPRRILAFAEHAFAEVYPRGEILKWLEEFYQRFFASQFKRNAMPDGPKVGTVALSPRGDWRMPSDAAGREWLEEVRELRQE